MFVEHDHLRHADGLGFDGRENCGANLAALQPAELAQGEQAEQVAVRRVADRRSWPSPAGFAKVVRGLDGARWHVALEDLRRCGVESGQHPVDKPACADIGHDEHNLDRINWNVLPDQWR